MFPTRFLHGEGESASRPARQRRVFPYVAVLLVCGIALLGSGCPHPLPLELPASLPMTLGVPQAQQQLKEVLLRALQPEILEVDVTPEFVIYRYRQLLAIPGVKPLTEHRVALLNIGRVEVYSNNVVLLWTPSNILLGQLIFGNYQDPKTCATMLLFLRDQRAQRG